MTGGYRAAGAERRPLGRPGERPQGFGAAATGGRRHASVARPRCTRAGVSRAGGRGRSHGRRWSVTAPRARRSWVEAAEHQPGPAVGLLGGARPRPDPAERLLQKSEGLLQVGAAAVPAPQDVQVHGGRRPRRVARRRGGLPPQPDDVGRAPPGGPAADLQTDDGPVGQAPGAPVLPHDARPHGAARVGVEPRPGTHRHLAGGLVGAVALGGRGGPGGRVVADERGPVPPRAAPRVRRGPGGGEPAVAVAAPQNVSAPSAGGRRPARTRSPASNAVLDWRPR